MLNNKKRSLRLSKTYRLFDHSKSVLSLYNDIRQYKTLSKEEIDELFRIYHNGSEKERKKAFTKLFNHNLKIVVSVARSYCSDNTCLDDLIQEGGIGLIKSIENFNVDIGTPFNGYSLYWIKKYIMLYKQYTSQTVLMKNISKGYFTLNKIRNKLFQELERNPSSDEILHEYNIQYPNTKINDIEDVYNVTYFSIDSDNKHEDSNDVFSNKMMQAYNNKSISENSYEYEIQKDYNKTIVLTLMDSLSETEKKIVTQYFGFDSNIKKTARMISEDMGISTSRINTILSKAIEKMREKSKELNFKIKY